MNMSRASYTDLNQFVTAIFNHQLRFVALLWIIGIAVVCLSVIALGGRLTTMNSSFDGLNEPRSRTYLRIAFGLLWIFDGVLQMQPAMPLGMANEVIKPAASGNPAWVRAIVNAGVGIWNLHPVSLAVVIAWLQVGLGLLILVNNGRGSRIAGGMSAAYALGIWVAGNALGGLLQNNSSILFGWPGATLFYAAAGIWIAAPRGFFVEHFSRWTQRGIAVVLAIGAVLQMLPDRGFWRGGNANALTIMTKQMASISQPHWLAWFVTKFGVIAGIMGGGFNLIVILWLVTSALGLWLTRSAHWPTRSLVVGTLVFWVGAQDTALFGGLATDVNSFVPLALLAWCAQATHDNKGPLPRRLPTEIRSSLSAVLTSFAVAMLSFAVVSASVTVAAGAENSVFLAINGPSIHGGGTAPSFTLTDYRGQSVHVGGTSSVTTVLSFLDPRCWTDCPLLAAQLRTIDEQLGKPRSMRIVAVAADPYHESSKDLAGFAHRHHLDTLKNFSFVTGSLANVKSVWNLYGITVSMRPTDKMSIHSDDVFIISKAGKLEWLIPDDPFRAWAAQRSAEVEVLHRLHQVDSSL